MKLTREGAARLGCHEARGFPVSDFEFKPEDFDGCFQNGKAHIALTTEEAKRLVNKAWLDMQGFACDELLQDIEERIKQAEIKHLKRENEQLKKEQARDNLEIERLEESYKNSTYSVLE